MITNCLTLDYYADDEAERKKKKAKSGDMGLVSMQHLNHNFKNKERLKAINAAVKPMAGITRADGSFSINENAVKLLKDVCIVSIDFQLCI